MDMEFKHLSELYLRVKPALTSKSNELKHLGFNYVKEEDIWNCLKEQKWSKTSNLTLGEIVDDILNIDNYIIDDYVKKQMINIPREVNLAESKILFNSEE